MCFPVYDDGEASYSSKYSRTAVLARVVTMVSLIVSIAVLQTNDATMDNGYVYTYKDFDSYRYIFYVAIIGIVYSLLQIPFAIYYMLRKKHLINGYNFLKFNFYADKVMALLVATAVGAAFGATKDLNSENVRWGSKMRDFFTVAYIPAGFTLVGCVASAISSLHSSLALTKT